MKKVRKNRASSLIATLLVLVVLSTIVVAFMQSMAIERMSARSSKNSLQAELAAEAGANAAKSQMLDLFSRYPDSATVWQIFPGTLTNEGTVFYFRGQNGAISTTSFPPATKAKDFNSNPGTVSNVQTYAWPLISGAVPVIATNLSNSFPLPIATDNSTDLNFQNWIGTAPSQQKKALRAQWVYLTNSAGVTNARYAFWVDDESFKVNISSATNVLRGTTSAGASPSEVPLQGVLSLAQGIPTNDTSANALAGLRTSLGWTNLLSFRTASQAFPLLGTNAVAEQLKFVATANSSSLNLSRDGWKRVNINEIFADGTNVDVRAQLDRFIVTVTNAAPLFGQRFYRTSYSLLAMNVTNTVTPQHSTNYLQKLAANVKDYVDEDSQPTIINNDAGFTVSGSTTPAYGIEPAGGGNTGDNPVVALGKENVPMLQEYVLRNRLISMSPAGWSGSNPGFAAFQFSSDHYLEFWNMGTKDIYATTNTVPVNAVNLGGSAFIKVYDQPGYLAVSPSISPGREFTIALGAITNLVFRAGQVTVITTDPDVNSNLVPSGVNIFQATIPTTDRLFAGTVTASLGGGNYRVRDVNGNYILNNSFQIVMDTRTTSLSDYYTSYLLGNNAGLIDSFFGLPIAWKSGGGSDAMRMNLTTPDRLASNPGSYAYFTRGGSLRGNSSATGPIATSGDPRSANEQMTIFLHGSGGGTDVTRYYNNLEDNAVPGDSSLGALNTQFVTPTGWPDYTLNSSSSSTAPAYFADGPMSTIGEFGNIYDPARIVGDSGVVAYSRGGGRTLHVGQPEAWSATTNKSGLWDGKRDSASRTWTAWRLADMFDTTTSDTILGSININGARRDSGLAIKAALKGYTYQPTIPSVGNVTLNDTQLNNLVGAITNRLGLAMNATNSPIFWERGELSELTIFQDTTNMAGVNMSQVIDRGREDLVRRTMNMVTTRGNTFTVYAVGQAVTVTGGKVKVNSTTRLKQTLVLTPSGMSSQVDTFTPTIPSEVSARFTPLTNYQAKSIWTSLE